MSNYPKPHRYVDTLGLKHIDGGTFIGKYRFPPPPARIALTDATTGLVKILSHGSPPTSVVLVSPQPQWRDVNTYDANEGPCRNGWMLWLNNGVLAFKLATGMNGQPILTRNNFDTIVLKVEPSATGAVTTSTYDLNSGIEA